MIEVQVREYPASRVTVPGAEPPAALPPVHEVRQGDGPPPAPAVHPRLGPLVLSLATLAIGVLGIVDLAGAAVPGSAYLAVPLGVVGAGLLLGAWYGRARWLIVVGVVLSVALSIVGMTERVATSARSVTWQPAGLGQLDRAYGIEFGDALLDLSALDFTGRSVSVRAHVNVGRLTVVVPPTVDVQARVGVDVGSAVVFGTRWGGLGMDERTLTDHGGDGPGGGDLVITATVDVGDLEVRR